MSALPMDVFGIVYIIDNAQQFWSELEDMLHLPEDATLDKLDSTLRRYISFCGSYHEQFLQSPLQLRHACDMIVASDLFSFHSDRMCELLVHDAQINTDPHYEMVLYSVILAYGRRNTSFLRNQKRWQPLLPLLMDHVRLDVDPEIDDGFYGSTSGSNIGSSRSIAIPIEAKLRSLSVKILYEVCRLQKMSLQDLRMFDDTFIDYLFDLVEQTREFEDETFNYSVIKLIVALNEQFMLATMQAHTPQPHPNSFAQQQADTRDRNADNRILRVLKSRVGSSPTFGENLIFMLNRADRTAEDLCMQLLVLKLLYLLFTSKDMAEYFYTNDLCVLVDVFLREIGDIDEDHESLRHTFLRVLHPLLTKTQLRNMPYKRPQIVHTLESLIQNESIRYVDPTTKRLVERCMSGEWCVQLRKSATTTDPRKLAVNGGEPRRGESPGLVAVSSVPSPHSATTMSMKSSALQDHHRPHRHSVEHSRKDSVSRVRHASGDSTNSFPRVATAADPHNGSAVPSKHRHRAGSFNVEAAASSFSTLSVSTGMTPISVIDPRSPIVDEPTSDPSPEIRVLSPASPAHSLPSPRHATLPAFSSSASSSTSSLSTASKPASSPSRRAAPPPPLKARRKPPAVPIRKVQLSPNGGPLSALAASSQPNLAALSSGRASAI